MRRRARIRRRRSLLTDTQRARLRELETVVAEGLAAYEDAKRQGLRAYQVAGRALDQIRREGLYREKFQTFEAYCRARWHYSASRARQLIAAARNTERLKDATRSHRPATESQSRALAGFAPRRQAEILERIEKSGKLTAERIRSTAREVFDELPAEQQAAVMAAQEKQMRITVRPVVDESERRLKALSWCERMIGAGRRRAQRHHWKRLAKILEKASQEIEQLRKTGDDQAA
jgi:hypothetical protein